MKWAEVLGFAAVLVFMVLYDWPKMTQQMKREKMVYGILTGLGAILSVLLVFYPEMPGPTQWFDVMYKPLVNLMEKLTVQRSG